VAHWKWFLSGAAVLAIFAGGCAVGHRVGYRSGYQAGLSNAPRCPVVNCEVKIEPSEQKCQSKIETRYVLRTIPSPAASCPPIVIPIPEVTYESEASGKQGGSEASVVVRPDERPPVGSGPAPSVSIGFSPSRWHASGLVGVGSAGVEVGAGLSYRLLGPIELGIYGRVPLHQLGQASGGLSVGLQF